MVDARGTTELHIAQRLPEGYTGINVVSRVYSTRETALLTPAFVQIMNDFSSHSNMTLNQDVCSGICTTTVKVGGNSESLCEELTSHDRDLVSNQDAALPKSLMIMKVEHRVVEISSILPSSCSRSLTTQPIR